MIFDIFRTRKNDDDKGNKKGDFVLDEHGQKKPLAIYKFDENATVKTYSLSIARNLMYDVVRKKYTKGKEEVAENEGEIGAKSVKSVKPVKPVKPQNAFEVELATYEATHKTTNLKITLNADPTAENGGFHKVRQADDFSLRYFETKEILNICLDKLAKEKPHYVTLISLFYTCELSYQDIADSGTTPYLTENSAKSHTSRAMAMLREIAVAEGLFERLDKKEDKKEDKK
jgi:DNA-directed RNA polymerase specialized sigma24 family protein